MTDSASPIRMLAILFFITAISFRISGSVKAEQLHEMPHDEAIVLLTRLADSWERCLKHAPYVSGRAKVNQESNVKSAPVKLRGGGIQNRQGDFERLNRVVTDFKADFKSQKFWCFWNQQSPTTWTDQTNGKIVHQNKQVEQSYSVLTEKNYYELPLGTDAVTFSQLPQPEELIRLDVQQNRDSNASLRRIAYRDSSRVGHQRTERSQMFDSSRLLKIGDKYPDQFLRNVVRHLETGYGVRISLIKKQPTVLLIQVPYRGTTEKEPVLFVESTWLASQEPAGPTMLLESVRMTLEDRFQTKQQNAEKVKSIYQTVWTWDSERLKQGLVVPVSWDYVVTGNSPTTSGFHCYVEIEKWNIVKSFPAETFTAESLNLRVGDLLYDKEHRVLSYQGANNRFLVISE
ncbi:hypothetical protein [Gimesia sp.]|uniref:hypothetical protein n=1 Tax=Gimesia sp. TaxID=2024833 RepID=UPI000C69850E|nr:hypothetical protein [Gimesia sp.]MAX35245.1 hypothetical protein [Gimesia sp.]HBL47574.1 hypothetical protein [Planctomycetaceae bacterium]|tara:strand:- start:145 stop:1350 length:1206 start_codon:yes stop_codon:yes gene_type:complete